MDQETTATHCPLRQHHPSLPYKTTTPTQHRYRLGHRSLFSRPCQRARRGSGFVLYTRAHPTSANHVFLSIEPLTCCFLLRPFPPRKFSPANLPIIPVYDTRTPYIHTLLTTTESEDQLQEPSGHLPPGRASRSR